MNVNTNILTPALCALHVRYLHFVITISVAIPIQLNFLFHYLENSWRPATCDTRGNTEKQTKKVTNFFVLFIVRYARFIWFKNFHHAHLMHIVDYYNIYIGPLDFYVVVEFGKERQKKNTDWMLQQTANMDTPNSKHEMRKKRNRRKNPLLQSCACLLLISFAFISFFMCANAMVLLCLMVPIRFLFYFRSFSSLSLYLSVCTRHSVS